MVNTHSVLKRIFNGRRLLCPFYFKEDLFINNFNEQRPNQRRNDNGDLVNEAVRFPNVRVIGPDGVSLGVMPRLRALQVDRNVHLDLVCVSKDANPPVCKILNYGKYRFEMQRKQKEMNRNQKAKKIDIKEVQLTPVIGQHDLETKIRIANKFLLAGDKVKIALRFRGRQLSHIEVGEEVINRFIAGCAENSTVEKEAKLDGKLLICILASKHKK